MKQLPPLLSAYHKTHVFTQDSIPSGLLGEHRTKAGTWGKIVVTAGSLRYRILGPVPEEHLLTPESFGVVEPTVPHQVQAVGPVEFFVEFYH
jgi:tellurite resistance-related uncharacterized protein